MAIIDHRPSTIDQSYASSERVYSVGIYDTDYPQRRMINNKAEGCRYVQVKKISGIKSIFVRIIHKFFPSLISRDTFGDAKLFTIYIPPNKGIDLIHTFNRIVLDNNHKWAATVETTLPAFFSDDPVSRRKYMNKRLKHILSDNCKAIMPMSKWAYDLEIQLLSKFASDDEAQCVKGKMRMLYPPQECFFTAEDVRRKCQALNVSQKFHFFYVGKDFVRKGGEIVIKVFDELSREYDNFSVIAIGNPKRDTARYNFTEESYEELMHIIKNSSWLQYYKSLPNDKVIELAKQSNVGLLPTFGDTFGFSILEMQSCGCPVITTNGEARSEINNDACGWMIDTKNLKPGNNTHDNIEIKRSAISSQLKDIVRTILDDPSCIEQKALRSIERIREYHSPSKYSEELKKIYALCR